MLIMAYTEAVPNPPSRLVWLVDTLATLKRFPAGVRHRLGFALYQAQIGAKHESAKLLRGFKSPIWQVRADDPSGTYGAVYVVQFRNTVCVSTLFRRSR